MSLDSKQELSVIFGTSQQSVVDKILQDASTTPFDANVRVPSRTTAYKGYVQMTKCQRKRQKKPQKKTPHVIIEK